jgi:hypothetical protein
MDTPPHWRNCCSRTLPFVPVRKPVRAFPYQARLRRRRAGGDEATNLSTPAEKDGAFQQEASYQQVQGSPSNRPGQAISPTDSPRPRRSVTKLSVHLRVLTALPPRVRTSGTTWTRAARSSANCSSWTPVGIDGEVDGEISANEAVVRTTVVTGQIKAGSVAIGRQNERRCSVPQGGLRFDPRPKWSAT